MVLANVWRRARRRAAPGGRTRASPRAIRAAPRLRAHAIGRGRFSALDAALLSGTALPPTIDRSATPVLRGAGCR